jgi:hypothetical protein
MSKSVLNAWDTGYIGPIAVCINQYFNCFIGEHIFLWLFLVSSSSFGNLDMPRLRKIKVFD